MGGPPPAEHQLLGVTLSNGVATIDIASELLELPAGAFNEFPRGEFDYLYGNNVKIDLRFSQLVFTATQFPFVDGVLFKLDGQPVKAQILNVQALKAALKLGPEPVTAQALWAQISEAWRAEQLPTHFWDDPGIYELVGRPVTRADYEGDRGEDAISRQGPAT